MDKKISDTNKKMGKKQIELLSNVSFSRRFSIMRSLSETTINLSRRAILRMNPNYNQKELDLEFIKLHYGLDLAERLKKYMENRAL